MIYKYKNGIYTKDTLDTVHEIESLIRNSKLDGTLGESQSGREISFSTTNLPKAWSFLIPLGVTPWRRYPTSGPEDNVYHVYGPWQPMMDRLMAVGRGDAVWSSFQMACQFDSGKEIQPQVEIQLHLHRLGYNPGPVDGVIGPLTLQALREAGFKDRIEVVLEQLRRRKEKLAPKPTKSTKLVLTGDVTRVSAVQTFGLCRSVKEESEVILDVAGGGRVILDFKE